MDVLYKRADAREDSTEEEESGEGYLELLETADDDEDLMGENFILQESPEDVLLPDLTVTYKHVVDTAREVVKFFRHVKNIDKNNFF
jgi:hypothetical protein